jgi:PAS domain S-box-containing protein
MGISASIKSELVGPTLDTIWDNLAIGIARIDEDGTFLNANPSFCAITEYTEYELQQRTFQSITLEEDRIADEIMAGRVARGEAKSYEMVKHYITKSRRVVRITLTVAAVERIDADGERHFEFFISQIQRTGLDMPTVAGIAAAIGGGMAAFWQIIKG